MSIIRRKTIPMVLLTVLGLFTVFVYYVPIPSLVTVSNSLQMWVTVIVGFAIFLGAISLSIKEYTNVRKRGIAWSSSVWFFIILIGTIVLYLVSGGSGKEPYVTWFNALASPTDAAIWSTLALMIFAALFRVFRVRSWESTLLIGSMIIVLLTNATVGEATWSGFPQIGNWLLQVPSLGASRGAGILEQTALIILGMRIILGYDKRVM